jgi:hypothetical protein
VAAGDPLSRAGAGEPGEVLELARGLLRRADPDTAGLWPRASALLARQALEASLGRVWARKAPGLESCSMRAQLICLRSYLGDPDLAARTGHAWSALSRACHHHPYELAPTAAELQALFSVVGELVAAVTDPAGRGAGSGGAPR